jgi:hypothetical protein
MGLCRLLTLSPSLLLSATAVLGATAGLGLAAPAAAAASMRDQMIHQFCSKAMAAELAQAGKTPPAGMVPFTCTCVVQQVDSGASVDQAKTVCKQQTLQKYGSL